ncbi:MAG: hypothetical protein KF752_13220 [Pirellulaceae bacterium]|nr:hypothetical protein [Pirellulaceae bacterium]
MIIKKTMALAALVAVCLSNVGQAEMVTWTIDTAQSWIRLTIPDQLITVGSSLVPAYLRGAPTPFDPNDPFTPNPVADWQDGAGRLSHLQGTFNSNYTEGSSVQFTFGDDAATIAEIGSFIPNRNFYTVGPPEGFNYHTLPGNGHPAAFAFDLTLGGFSRIAPCAIWGMNFDANGTVNLSGTGPWTGNANTLTVGGENGSILDFWAFSITGSDRITIGTTQGTNTGNLTIENTGGQNRKLTMGINCLFTVLISGLPLENSRFDGQIVATATLPSPAANLVAKRVYHNGFGGGGTPPWNAVNPTKEIIQRGAAPVQVGLINLTNDSRGLNGVVLDYDNLAALGDLTLEYKMSPTGAFNEGANPVSGWANAPAPTSVTLHPDLAAAGGNDRVRILWADNAIANRYLCIKATVGGNTKELYVGHLRGETTGPDATPTFTVSFADITEIKNTVAQIVGAGGPTDIDKNGTVAFADITAMRDNISAQLTRITIPVSP